MLRFSTISGRAALGLGALLLAVMLPRVAVAAEAPADSKVVLAVDGIAVVRNLPVLLATHQGYFKDEGLSVTLMETAANAKVDEMLADGRVAGMVAYYHHTIVAHSEGRAWEAVITMAVTPGYELLIANRLKGSVARLSELKGKRIISGGPHSAKSTSANWLMLHQGYQITDYTPIAPTNRAQIAEALRTGGADFVIAPEPDAGFYEAQGVASVFADLYSVEGVRNSLGEVFPSTVLYMDTGYANAHPELARHLVRAFVRALKFINTHSVAEIAAQVPEIAAGEGKEPRVIAQGVKMFATDGLMPEAAARMEAKAISALFPEYARVDIARTFTNEFIAAVLGR
jgi:NitT/TauT family transport system substrate-binding protein